MLRDLASRGRDSGNRLRSYYSGMRLIRSELPNALAESFKSEFGLVNRIPVGVEIPRTAALLPKGLRQMQGMLGQ